MDRRGLAALLVVPLTVVCLGCPGPAPKQGSDAGPSPTSATATIGLDGGTLTLDGAILTFPIGALSKATHITLTHTIDAPPAGFDQGAVLWRVDPAGLVLARPAALSIPFAGAAATAAGFWSTPSGASYERVGVDVANGTATLRPVELGSGFVGSPSGHTTLTVYVTRTKLVYTKAGTTAVPADLSTGKVEVLVPNASQGYDTYTGTGDAQGVGRVTGVPPSPTYYIGTTLVGGIPTFVATPHATLDQATLQDGRTTTTTSSTGTSITLDASGLTAWKANDAIEYQTLAFFGTQVLPASITAHPPAAGATSVTGAVLDWSQLPVLDASQGDTVLLFHRRPVTLPSGLGYSDILDMATLSGVTLVDGQTVKAQATFAPVTQTPLSLSIDGATFEQAMAGLAKPAKATLGADDLLVSIYYTPAPPKLGIGTDGVDLLDGSMTPGPTGTLNATVSYPDPWPGQGAHQVDVVRDRSYSTPGNTGYTVVAYVVTTMPLSSVGAGTSVAPLVGCVRAVEVNGQPLTAPVTGVGMTPKISWQAPAFGTPDGYTVTIHVASAFKWVLNLRTTATSVVVPSGLLKAGTSYTAVIWADASPGHDPILNAGPPGAQVTATNALLSTPPFTP